MTGGLHTPGNFLGPGGGNIKTGKFMPSFAAIPSPGRHVGAGDTRRDSQTLDPISQAILTRNVPSSGPRVGPSRNSLSITPSSRTSKGEDNDRRRTRSRGDSTNRGDTLSGTRSTSASGDRRRTSFLSRFVPPKKKPVDAHSETTLPSPSLETSDPAAFYSPPIGYVPQFPRPARYLKVKSHGQKDKRFSRLFLAQELRGRTGAEIAQAGGRPLVNGIPPPHAFDGKKKNDTAIWGMEFSKDGRFLAAGGKDYVVRVWAVIASQHERNQYQVEEDGQQHLQAPVFQRKSVQEYAAHTASILDLSWSKNNFLLSSSMDKTVRLWHASREECLCCFKHTDFVTSIQFHPRDDRFFLAGSLDSKLRLWSIPDKSVAYWVTMPSLITAVAFTPDGGTAIAGCLNGMCNFYDTESLKYQSQVHVRSAHGKYAKGSKITGIQSIPDAGNPAETKILVTTNDSRIRVYNMRDKGLSLKLKGNENFNSQIQASVSDDASYIICGSEDKRTYIWPLDSPELDRDKCPVESFEAHQAIVTKALMAPTKTRQLLSASADPVYDLCNPPPVTLVSRRNSQHSSLPPVDDRKPEESPAYQARSIHSGGQIIVTADVLGHIRVFRQDCAYESRIRNNNDSTLTKRILGRTGSMATKTSGNSSSDRILSWRQSIEHGRTQSAPRGRSPPKARPTSGGPGAALAKLNASTSQVWESKEDVLQDSQSYMYWKQDVNRTGQLDAQADSDLLAPPSLHREVTAVSILSSEDETDVRKSRQNPQEIQCQGCKATAFRVRMDGERQTLICSTCGEAAG